nr:hypothetical protein [Ktedonobacter robiniae]
MTNWRLFVWFKHLFMESGTIPSTPMRVDQVISVSRLRKPIRQHYLSRVLPSFQ